VLEIKVNPEYEKILPKLSGEEFEALKASIQNDGQLYPIIINQKGVILDGHNRYHVCVELKFVPKTFTMPFDDPLLEKKFVIEVNLKRRHLNLFQKAEMGILLMDIEKAIAKTRQGKPSAQLGGKSGDARDIVSQRIGVGRGTFERAQKVIASANEETKDKLRKGEWSINYAYNGYNAIGKAPEDKQEVLREQFEKEELMAPQITKIVEESQKAVELLGNTSEKIQKEFEEKYKDELWTADLKFKDFAKEVSVAEGNPADRVRREIDQSLMTKDEVTKLAKKCGGYFVGEAHYWIIMVNPLLFKEPKKKVKEDEEE